MSSKSKRQSGRSWRKLLRAREGMRPRGFDLEIDEFVRVQLGKAGKRRRSGGSKLPAAQRSRGSSSRSRRSSEPPARSEAGGSDDESIPAAIGARVTSWFEDDEWYAGVIAACATFVPGMFFIKYVYLPRVRVPRCALHAEGIRAHSLVTCSRAAFSASSRCPSSLPSLGQVRRRRRRVGEPP